MPPGDRPAFASPNFFIVSCGVSVWVSAADQVGGLVCCEKKLRWWSVLCLPRP
jgi:hypothetical protein